MSEQTLRDEFDAANESGRVMHCGLYLDELRRRESAHSEKRMVWLTGVVTVLTAANAAFVAYTIWK